MEAFDVAIFVGMYEVEGGGADKLMRFVTCADFSGSTGEMTQMLTKEFTNGLCHKNPAGLEVGLWSTTGVKLGQ